MSLEPDVARSVSRMLTGRAMLLHCNDTLPEWSEVVKSFTPECGGKTPRGVAPRGFPDTRGGNTFTTERERGVMSLP